MPKDHERNASGEAMFAGLTVAVTGAGRGLGRQYCIDLAAQGANVVAFGRGANVEDAANEIAARGGIAFPVVGHDVGAMVDAARQRFGGLDALIVNAGSVQDRSFAKMSDAEWNGVIAAHLEGARAAAAAAWPAMIARGRGRIVLTTSGAGLHGNFGQANYAAAKAAIVGLARTLAYEGARHDVLTNAVAPMALTEMTGPVFTAALAEALRPDLVSPYVLALCHPSSQENGAVIETGGGWAAKVRWQRAQGVRLSGAELSVAGVLQRWRDVADFTDAPDYPTTIQDCLEAAATASRGVH